MHSRKPVVVKLTILLIWIDTFILCRIFRMSSTKEHADLINYFYIKSYRHYYSLLITRTNWFFFWTLIKKCVFKYLWECKNMHYIYKNENSSHKLFLIFNNWSLTKNKLSLVLRYKCLHTLNFSWKTHIFSPFVFIFFGISLENQREVVSIFRRKSYSRFSVFKLDLMASLSLLGFLVPFFFYLYIPCEKMKYQTLSVVIHMFIS